MKNWKTTLFGILAALPALLHSVGVAGFGHLGSVSIDTAISSVGVLLLGWFAKDKNVTGGTTPNDVTK
jgi:hypothetical protein